MKFGETRCEQVREEFFNPAGSPAMDEHLRSCAACRAELEQFRATMALLDHWQAPEPSPYFNAKLRARMRDEAAAPRGWREWVRAAMSPFTLAGRRVALATTMALLMVAGVAMIQGTRHPVIEQITKKDVKAPAGTAVGDLQALDKNQDLVANFDLLDDDQPVQQ